MRIQWIRYTLLFALSSLLTSCGIYSSRFQCPAGKGVGCASVGEVLDLIVEKEEGEDRFVSTPTEARIEREKTKVKSRKHSRRTKQPPKKFELIKDASGKLILVEAEEKQLYADY